MSRKLYAGNLPYQTDVWELQELFGQFGSVESVRVMRDMATGRARGFAFVEMATDQEAQAAAARLNGHQLGGRTLYCLAGIRLRVSETRHVGWSHVHSVGSEPDRLAADERVGEVDVGLDARL